MAILEKLETKLDDLFVKYVPLQLPDDIRQWLAGYAYIFAFIGAILGALSALLLASGVLFVSDSQAVLNTQPVVHHQLAVAWLALICVSGYTVLTVMAVPKLKRKTAAGWRLLFYSSLLFIGFDICFWLQAPTAVLSLISNLIGALVGLYFLFQVRSYFVHAKRQG